MVSRGRITMVEVGRLLAEGQLSLPLCCLKQC